MKIQPINSSDYKITTSNLLNNNTRFTPKSNTIFKSTITKKMPKFNLLDFIKNLFRRKPKEILPPPLTPVQQIAKNIENGYGIECDFAECMNVAECTAKVVYIMNYLFGRNSLPQIVKYEPISPGSYGEFDPVENLTEIERRESKLKQKTLKGVVDVVASKLWSLGGILTNRISNIADYCNRIGAKITKSSNGIKIHDNQTKLRV